MKYKIQKILVTIIGSMFVIAGIVALIVALPAALKGYTNYWPIVIFGLGFSVGGFLVAFLTVSAISRLERKVGMTFDWFKNKHPQAVTGDRIACISCGGTRIHVRGLMQQTYLREHFCTRCGTALYYSPEG